jgi:probable F420-dependent oxidoreductase
MGQTAAMTYRLAGTGIWSASLRYGDPAAAADAATELEEQGWSAVWIPDVGGDLFAAVGNLLTATSSMTVATGILNLWMHEPADTAAAHRAFVAEHGRRFLVGIGVSRAADRRGDRRGGPPPSVGPDAAYLDELDAASPPLPAEDHVLAALGPKMLELARERASGSHRTS